MSELSEQELAVARHYDETIFEYEATRLSSDCPLEFAIVTRYLERYLPADAVIAEVGVGVGHYSEWLARRGARLYLVDVADRLLQTANERLQTAGLGSHILGAHRASATHLDSIAAGTCQAVLLLGPVYHLCALTDRQRAVSEAARVLEPDGLVFGAAINRLAYLRDTFRHTAGRGASWRAFHDDFLCNGNLDPVHAPPIGFAHLSTVSELRELFAPAFDELALVGVESFTGVWQAGVRDLSPADAAAWLDLVEETGKTPEGLGASDHFLYIGRRHT
jgi:ubiquinone/menaquinone biosynthesis C-methylase UbiE